MPLKWNINRADRLVIMVAEGEVTLAEAEEYLDALVVADAMPYAKLVDCSKMVTHVDDDEMMRLGPRLQAYVATLKGGQLVFVVITPEICDYTHRYINLSTGAARPVTICRTVDEAKPWLEAQRAK